MEHEDQIEILEHGNNFPYLSPEGCEDVPLWGRCAQKMVESMVDGTKSQNSLGIFATL